MGEETKKPEKGKKQASQAPADEDKPKAKEEEKKDEAAKTEDGGGVGDGNGEKEGGEEKKAAHASPPAEEIVMRVFMHCKGCARKVKQCLKGFDGVEDVMTECRNHKVVVKGKKAAEDPMKVVERVQKKTGRKVELLTPLPPPKPEKKEEKTKPEEKKEVQLPVIAVDLKVHMHCEACAQEIKKRILKMKGVQGAEPDVKSSQVTVKGIFEPSKLVEYVYKRTGKHAAVVKQDPADKKPEDETPRGHGKDEKKVGGGEAEGMKDEKEGAGGDEKEKDSGAAEDGTPAPATGTKVVELMRNEYYYQYPRYGVGYTYPPQIFSDENPNACSVM